MEGRGGGGGGGGGGLGKMAVTFRTLGLSSMIT